MEVLRRLLFGLGALAALAYALAVLVSAVSFYRSSQGVAYHEIQSLEIPLTRLKDTWQEKGQLSAAQDTLSKKNLELQAARADAVKATDKRVVLDKLAVVSANLSFIEEVLRNQRSTAAEAVKELDAKVAAAKKRIGPPDAPDRIIEVFFRETGRVFLAAVWPAVVVGIVLYLLLSKAAPGRLRAMFKGFKSFELGGTGAKIEFSPSEEAKATMEGAFQSYRDEAKLQYD